MTGVNFRIASAILFFVLAGCNRGRNLEAVINSPVDQMHLTLAIGAVNNLRDLFNNRACPAIYDSASPSFRSQPKEDWLSECVQLRQSLGAWRSFNPRSTIRCGAPEAIICVEGSSVFENGHRSMEVAWQLDRGQTQLLWLDLLEGNHQVLIPALPSRKYLDSPPRDHKDRKRSG